ncbi:carbohydrate ABC transporter permease [Propionibacteriaceae bacterium Y1700]|uniref:carbohydrate ABC transporter permease n=1 Tax=Microlunatus sp. Y1700 TaxID=3418487 RepID=UPI003DA7566D
MTDVNVAATPGSSGAAPRRRRPRLTLDNVSFFAVFLGLPLIIYVIFVISPFAQAFYYSMTNWSGFSPDMKFIGLKNYQRLFSDEIFLKALGNNVFLAIVLPLTTIILALALATMATVGGSSVGEVRGLRGSALYRVVTFFPYVVPAVAIGIIWSMMYDPSSGLVNGILVDVFGVDSLKSFAWLGDPRTAMGATIFVILWSMTGFYMVLFVAAIQGVEKEIFEAARLDGAGRFRTAISITLPLIRENVQTAYVYLGILALDAFVYMQVMNSAGGPEYSTVVMSQRLFKAAFTDGQAGLASAMGVVLAVVTLLFASLVFLVNRLTGGESEGKKR